MLIRHGESQWNKERRFVSWVDVPLTDKGCREAQAAGRAISEAGFKIDAMYTSFLKRAIKTAWHVLEECDSCHVHVHTRWQLNERFVGCLIGHTMDSALQEFGTERVRTWRTTGGSRLPSSTLLRGSCYRSVRFHGVVAPFLTSCCTALLRLSSPHVTRVARCLPRQVLCKTPSSWVRLPRHTTMQQITTWSLIRS